MKVPEMSGRWCNKLHNHMDVMLVRQLCNLCTKLLIKSRESSWYDNVTSFREGTRASINHGSNDLVTQ